MVRSLPLMALVACTGTLPDLPYKVVDTGAVDDTGPVDDTGGGSDGGSTADWEFPVAAEGGCGDTYLWAVNAEETQGFVFQFEGEVAAAFAAGAAQAVDIDLSASGAGFAVEGVSLRSLQCNDAVPDGPMETGRYLLAAGQGTLTITPDLTVEPTDYNMPAAAHLDLSGVQFVDDAGVSFARAALVIDANVGWFPG